MSAWLARLGRFCAHRAKTVLALWLAALIGAAAAAAAFNEGTTAAYSIPHAEYEEVLDELGEEIETFSGGSVLVMLSSTDGSFDEAQQEGVAALSEELERLDVVLEADDPFTQQEELDEAPEEISEVREDLTGAEQELDQAEEDVAEGREDLASQQEELDAGWEQLETMRAQLGEEHPSVLQTEAELDAGQEQADEASEELDEAAAEAAEGREDLEERSAELDLAERQEALNDGMRTVSQDGDVALLSLQISVEAHNLTPDQQEEIIEAVEESVPQGVEADYDLELVQDVTSILGTSEIVGLAVAALVLLITLGTVVAAGLPVGLALLGVGIAVAGVFALSGVIDMTDTDPVLALMLGLSLGIDYTLLLLYRHRSQLAQGMSLRDSLGLATGTAGSAILFAGVTNVIALGALAVTGIPFLTVMGLAASATIAVVVAAVLTLGPAAAALLGRRILPARLRPENQDDAGSPLPTPAQSRPARTEVRHEQLSDAARLRLLDRGWGRFITRRPWLAILAPLLILGTLAIPAADLRMGLPDGASEPEDSTAYTTYDTVRESFGAGENGPMLVVARLPEGIDAADQDERVTDLAEDLSDRAGIVRAVPAGSNEGGDLQVIQAVPGTGPNDEVTSDLVTTLLDHREALAQEHRLQEVGLTGQTVANIEIAERLHEALPLYVGIVVVLCLLILMAVFRSLAAPVLAAGGYVLSLLASLGAVVAIYQWGWLSDLFGVTEPAPILAFLPILMCGVLFGLAIDYQLFIMSGVREAHVRGDRPRLALLRGLKQGGPVVTACGIIMVSVFAGFVFAELTMIRPIGFGLAIGVLLEAFLVRATLIPATTYLLGRWAWALPRWLERLLPQVDVEGQRLEESMSTGSAGGRRVGERWDGSHSTAHEGGSTLKTFS